MKCFPALLYKKKIGSRNIDMRLWILLCTIEISALISAKNDSLTHSREVTHKRALPRRGWLTAGRLRRRGEEGKGEKVWPRTRWWRWRLGQVVKWGGKCEVMWRILKTKEWCFRVNFATNNMHISTNLSITRYGSAKASLLSPVCWQVHGEREAITVMSSPPHLPRVREIQSWLSWLAMNSVPVLFLKGACKAERCSRWTGD